MPNMTENRRSDLQYQFERMDWDPIEIAGALEDLVEVKEERDALTEKVEALTDMLTDFMGTGDLADNVADLREAWEVFNA